MGADPRYILHGAQIRTVMAQRSSALNVGRRDAIAYTSSKQWNCLASKGKTDYVTKQGASKMLIAKDKLQRRPIKSHLLVCQKNPVSMSDLSVSGISQQPLSKERPGPFGTTRRPHRLMSLRTSYRYKFRPGTSRVHTGPSSRFSTQHSTVECLCQRKRC